jgi:hypothetical protein
MLKKKLEKITPRGSDNLSVLMRTKNKKKQKKNNKNNPYITVSLLYFIWKKNTVFILLKAGHISPQTLIHHQEYHHNGDDTLHHCEYHHISEETGQMEMNPFNKLNLILSTVYIITNEQF